MHSLSPTALVEQTLCRRQLHLVYASPSQTGHGHIRKELNFCTPFRSANKVTASRRKWCSSSVFGATSWRTPPYLSRWRATERLSGQVAETETERRVSSAGPFLGSSHGRCAIVSVASQDEWVCEIRGLGVDVGCVCFDVTGGGGISSAEMVTLAPLQQGYRDTLAYQVASLSSSHSSFFPHRSNKVKDKDLR